MLGGIRKTSLIPKNEKSEKEINRTRGAEYLLPGVIFFEKTFNFYNQEL